MWQSSAAGTPIFTIWSYDDAEEGTRVTIREEVPMAAGGASKVFGRLSRPVIVGIRRRVMRSELQNLKLLLEA